MWNITYVVAHKPFYNTRSLFYQQINTSLEEASSTTPTKVVLLLALSYSVNESRI